MSAQHQTTTTLSKGVCKKIRRKGLDEAQLKNDIKNAIQSSYLNKIKRITRSSTGALVPWLGAPHRGVGVANFRCTDIEITLVPNSAGGNNTTREAPCSSTGVVGSNKFNYTDPTVTTVTPPQCPPSSLAGRQETFTWGSPSAEAFFRLTGSYITVRYKVQEKYEFHSNYLGNGSYSGSIYYPGQKGPFALQPARELSEFDKTVTGTSTKSNTVLTTCPY